MAVWRGNGGGFEDWSLGEVYTFIKRNNLVFLAEQFLKGAFHIVEFIVSRSLFAVQFYLAGIC
jgi:hypothetical protein